MKKLWWWLERDIVRKKMGDAFLYVFYVAVIYAPDKSLAGEGK